MFGLIPCVLFFHYVYIKVRPYKKHLTVLHWMEIMSSGGFCFLILFNQFKGFFYVFDIQKKGPVNTVLLAFTYTEIFVSPIMILVIYFMFIPLCSKILKCFKRHKSD